MTRLTWTTEKPTTPGAYWYKDMDGVHWVVIIAIRWGALDVDGINKHGTRMHSHINLCKGQWAGPLEEPEEG